MQPTALRRFGRTGLKLTAMGFGTAPLGNQFRVVKEEDSRAVFARAWEAGIRYYDTAPLYGHGLSEHRTGEALRWYPREDYILSTKVGRLLKPARRRDVDFTIWNPGLPFEIVHDYSYDGAMRSFEDSLQRLSLERIDIAFIHDIDHFSHADAVQEQHYRTAMGGAYKALKKLRDESVVKAIGLGVNEWQVCERALKEGDFDCFLLAGRYTLLEQDALDSFLPLCETRDVAIVLGGAFNSGILATGATETAMYNYAPAPEPIKARVRQIEAVCRDHDVPLMAAALQFVLAHPCVTTVVPGTRDVKHLDDALALLSRPIPAAFWQALRRKGLVAERAPVPA